MAVVNDAVGEARRWLQWNKINGDTITWGSTEELRPAMTAKDVDDMAIAIAKKISEKHGIGKKRASFKIYKKEQK